MAGVGGREGGRQRSIYCCHKRVQIKFHHVRFKKRENAFPTLPPQKNRAVPENYNGSYFGRNEGEFNQHHTPSWVRL